MATGRSLPEFDHEGKPSLADTFAQPWTGAADISTADDARAQQEREIFVQPPPDSVRQVTARVTRRSSGKPNPILD